ncbi:DUF6603 domain-containing protein [Candidatus Binatus sp.]|uniref:DUF6603 domain-containing protein n=1 Tax=Candidatus Binatus sp. TaxID=2811406 RepID=UPI003CC5C0B3
MTLVEALVTEIGKFLQPLASALDDPVTTDHLLAQIGANAEKAGGDPLVAALRAIAALGSLIVTQASQQSAPSFEEIAAFLETSRNTVQAIEALSASSGPAADLEGFGRDLLDLLIVAYLANWHPLLREVTTLLTLIEPAEAQTPSAEVTSGDTVVRESFQIDRVHLERLPALLRDPRATLTAYYWNGLQTEADADAIADKLFVRVRNVLLELNVDSRYGIEPSDTALFGGEAPLIDHALLVYASNQLAGAEVDAGIALTLSPAEHGDLGLVVSPFGVLQESAQFGLWKVDFQLGADLQAFAIGRNGPTLLASTSTVAVDAEITATLAAPDSGPAFVYGSPTGSRLEVGGAQLTGEVKLSESDQSGGVSASVSKSAIVISPGDGDGFLRSILPANGARAQFDLGLAWTNTGGLKIKGAGGLDVDVPAGLSLGGVVTIDSIHLGIRADDSSVTLESSANAGLNLGPVHVIVNRMGMLTVFTFPDQGGNLGPLDAALSFKPPSGMGIAIDAGCVTGGGFLSFDPVKSQYEGAASLKIEGVGVSALGLVQTQPDVSFLLLIATTFPEPIQLGLDFSLAGVGGLAGINRTIDLNALETAVWKGTAQDLLFPSAPIGNAVAVLGELNTLFPAAPGHYVFGPTGKIFWGTPPILTAQVGLVLELPSPIRVAILGSVVAQFPPVKSIVFLKVNFAGGIDFGTSRFFFDASLIGSRIESYPISGALSLRGSWASPKSLALAVGGFNPHFQPPAGFPSLARITLDISNGPIHFHLAAYLAITSNTFQIGAAADLRASICDCAIAGHFAFDALFVKNPFSFQVDLDASASVSFEGDNFAGVHISGTLSGPAPWHAQGSASISLLFFSVGIDFNRTWGADAPSTLPPVDPWTSALAPALADPGSWRSELPPSVHPVVTFAQVASGGAILLDPAGNLVLDQKAVPLNQPIERFAETALPAAIRFDLASPAVNGAAVDASGWSTVSNEFAPAQFTQMTDDQKLSAESFVSLPSGMTIGASTSVGTSVGAALTYDLIILDSTRKAGPRVPFLPTRDLQLSSAATGPAARAPWRAIGLSSFAAVSGAAPKASLGSRSFSIVSTANLAVQAPAVASTRYEASLALAAFATLHAVDPTSIQTMPQRESA